MKKKIICLVLAVALLCGILSGCKASDSFKPSGENLAVGATYTQNDKTSKKFNFTSGGKNEVKIKFPSAITFNTIVLNETTDTVTAFEFWAEKDGKLELVYKQDEINGLRYCFFDKFTTDNLTFRAFAVNGKLKVNKFEVYNIDRKENGFRTTTYLPMWQFLNEYATNPSRGDGLNHVTDIILFGGAHYNEKGELDIDHQQIDDTLTIINKVRAGNPIKPTIYCDFTLNSDIKNEKDIAGNKFFASLQKIALKENKNTLIANLNKFTQEKKLSGISFDYEYPYTFDDYKVYSDFLVDLKASAPEQKLAIAVAPWGLKYTDAAKKAVDVFEVMSYDLMDKRGNHCGWENNCVHAIDYMISNGYPKEKIDLGLAFYSRPIDYGDHWDSWLSDVENISKFGNYTSIEKIGYYDDAGTRPFLVKGRWHNGENIIMDKTAYCYDIGVGGVMMFQYNCDTDYSHERSLLASVNRVLGRP